MQDKVNAYVNAESAKLRRVPKGGRKGGVQRELYVLPAIWDLCIAPPELPTLWEKVIADLTYFADGRELPVRKRGVQRDGPVQSRIAPLPPYEEEVWELRMQVRRSGVRIFGSFYEQNKFLGLWWRYKRDLQNSYTKYQAAMAECRAVWEGMFPGEAPLTGAHPDDYLTYYYLVPRD
jgi:hypothetical protein